MKRKLLKIVREVFPGRDIQGYFYDHGNGRRYGYYDGKCREVCIYDDSFSIDTDPMFPQTFFNFDEVEELGLNHSDSGFFSGENLELHIQTKTGMEARFSIGRK